MATSFKTLLSDNVKQSLTKLHEAIPLTGTILSGTYNDTDVPPNPLNVKNYSHGMFQSVYDYPYLSSSANHILDLTLGMDIANMDSADLDNIDQQNQKQDIYNEMAQILCGYDSNGNINKFDALGSFSATPANKMGQVYFINLARLLTKDELQKVTSGGVSLQFNVDQVYSVPQTSTAKLTLLDSNATNALVNSPAGEYNILYGSTATATPTTSDVASGLLFYQAGIAVLTASIFETAIAGTDNEMDATAQTAIQLMVSGAISSSADAIRHRVNNISFNNTTELNSTIYFCRAGSNEFNYSSNPTYLDSSKLRVKNVSTDDPVSYITTVGLYGANNELLAVGKLSEPLKKTPADEYTLRVRLDY
ncbi:MAG: hypothetical protein NZ811_03090 [Gammaproteobacteria bacterium]|nr:hypothetical protein [Gammaproteobacteria bacterium]